MRDHYSIYLFQDKDLSEFLDRSDQACLIKNYALVFDNMFGRGLDLSKRLPKPLPRNSRVFLDLDSIALQSEELRNLAFEKQTQLYNLFLLFIDIKKTYENKMREFGNPAFAKDQINKLIQYGTWSYPDSVRKVLSIKYRNVTRDKYNSDMKYYQTHKE